jgi:hypothetical protein
MPNRFMQKSRKTGSLPCPFNGMDIEAKRSERFDNDVFFDIEAKRTHSIVEQFISKRSEHVYIKELKNRSEANTFDSLKIYFEAKRKCFN